MKGRKALTLMETMIAATLLTIVIAASYGVLRSNQITQQTGETTIQLYRETRRAAEAMSRDLKFSSFGKITIINNSTAADEIKFQVPVSINSSSGEITWGAKLRDTVYPDRFLHYFIEDNYLKKEVVDEFGTLIGGPVITAKNIVDLQIQRVNLTGGGSYLQLHIQARKTILFLQRALYYNLTHKIFPLN